MDENELAAVGAVVADLAGELFAEPELVAELVGVVDDARLHAARRLDAQRA